MIDDMDILAFNFDSLYTKMYEDIVSGKGIKPKEVFYLQWLLQKNSDAHGYGKNGIGKLIHIPRELL
jgi:hypothetical protein